MSRLGTRRSLLGVAVLVALGAGCGGRADGKVDVVASFYPLAWVAAEVGGTRVAVVDLTPAGGEAHDVVLTAGQRADLQTADLVLLLGRFGFQPEIERAAEEAVGRVVDVTSGLDLTPSATGGLRADPHVWLDASAVATVAETVADELAAVDPRGAGGYRARASELASALSALDAEYRDGLASCAVRTFVSSHEAFGYLAARYDLEQMGILGLAPESEPTAARLEDVRTAIRSGEAAPAVFAESTAEGLRVAESVAGELGVPVLPLATLESAPPSSDYLSAMRENLGRLREGLGCR